MIKLIFLRSLQTKLLLLGLLFLMSVQGCASSKSSPSILQLQHPLPAIIAAYQHLDIQIGTVFRKNTGIYIAKDSLYTVLAKGENCSSHLAMEIGSNPASVSCNTTHRADFSGNIFFKTYSGRGYSNKNYSIDIIVWATADLAIITEYLKKEYEKKPNDYTIAHAYNTIRLNGEIFLAEKKTQEEIEITRQAIYDIKGETQTAKNSISDTRIQNLESRLVQLTAQLADLERMKQELKLAQAKATQLTYELEEKQEMEQQLLIRLSENTKLPPVLVITAPADGVTTESRHLSLFGVAEDDRGLKKLEIHVNGNKLYDEDVRGISLVNDTNPHRLEFNRRIDLLKGVNRIRIRIIDSDGLFTEKFISAKHIERRHNVWAVIVGVNSYPNLRKLKYAVNDARGFYDWIVKFNRIPEQNITLLLDDQATLKKLRSSLGTQIKNAAGIDDLVIIYFAGHGAVERDMHSPDGDGLEKYLLPYDTDPSDLYATALPMREIAHIFNRIRSERLIFLADACYSGATGGRTISVSELRSNLSDTFLTRLSKGRGKIIITASGANEVSAEKDTLRHGVFTYYLLEGLRGAADNNDDGVITVDEAYDYVSVAVPKHTNQEQHPMKKGTVEGQLIMGIVE